MIDVVELATARRADLAAEIAKIDDFIRMAAVLAKYGQRLSHDPVVDPVVDSSRAAAAARTAESDLPDILSGDEALAVDDAPVVDGGKAGDDTAAPDRVGLATPMVVPAVTTGPDPTDAGSETVIAGELARKRNTDKVSTVPDHFVFDEKAAEKSDELVLINPMSSAPGPVDAHIGLRLRQRRWMMGMSQQQLGKIVGVSFDQIQQFELGAARISVKCMWDIAATLEVPVSYFFENLEGQAVDTGESRSGILTEEEAIELVGAVPSARSA